MIFMNTHSTFKIHHALCLVSRLEATENCSFLVVVFSKNFLLTWPNSSIVAHE